MDDDQGWWLGGVEFTPPRTAGSGLYVGAMWLWHDVDHLAFHVDAVRTGPELFRTQEQFTPPALDLSRQAAAHVTALREKFHRRIRSVRWLYRRVRPATCSTNVRRPQETSSQVKRRT